MKNSVIKLSSTCCKKLSVNRAFSTSLIISIVLPYIFLLKVLVFVMYLLQFFLMYPLIKFSSRSWICLYLQQLLFLFFTFEIFSHWLLSPLILMLWYWFTYLQRSFYFAFLTAVCIFYVLKYLCFLKICLFFRVHIFRNSTFSDSAILSGFFQFCVIVYFYIIIRCWLQYSY